MRWAWIFFSILIIYVLNGCSGHSTYTRVEGDTITHSADYLTLINCGDWVAAEVRAPWSDTVPIARYAIVYEENINIPEGFAKVKAPLERAVIFSSVYSSAVEELEKSCAIKGVADGGYYLKTDSITKLIEAGEVIDVGSSISPLLEKVVDCRPDAILLSPYATGSPMGLERIGVPMIWMADYMESSPLGRAEWILFLGEIFGEREKANSIYAAVKERYNNFREIASSSPSRPKVMAEKPLSGIWYVPGGESYIAQLIGDAGGDYLWSDTKDSGSIPLDESAVIDRGAEADIWLFKDIKDYDALTLEKELLRAKALKPFPSAVYFCNTLATPYYNVIAFHPDKVLMDMVKIFHPEMVENEQLEFYQPLK